MSKVGLVVVFNHAYERNVPRLEEYYQDRFSLRRYLIPFSMSGNANVVRVVENGWTFGGHISQGLAAYNDPTVSHYLFIGDDLVLNPALDEANLIERLGLDQDTAYIKSLVSNDSLRYRWHHSIAATQSLRHAGFDYEHQLPSAKEARQRFEAMGVSFPSPRPASIRDLRCMTTTFPRRMFRSWLAILRSIGKVCDYPLLAGYSDFLLVPAGSISQFAHYCGVFSAMNMFAEVAVPTALALSCMTIKTELLPGHHFGDMPLKRGADSLMKGIEFWGKEVHEFGSSMQYDWNRMMKSFSTDLLYYHPVKLTAWK